jgi:hypothetical protein
MASKVYSCKAGELLYSPLEEGIVPVNLLNEDPELLVL